MSEGGDSRNAPPLTHRLAKQVEMAKVVNGGGLASWQGERETGRCGGKSLGRRMDVRRIKGRKEGETMDGWIEIPGERGKRNAWWRKVKCLGMQNEWVLLKTPQYWIRHQL